MESSVLKKHSLPRSPEGTHPVMGSVGSSRREETNLFTVCSEGVREAGKGGDFILYSVR